MRVIGSRLWPPLAVLLRAMALRRPSRPCAWSCCRISRSSIRCGPRPTSCATTATWSTTRCWRWTPSSPIKPQMLEGWKVSDDKLTYTFTLRDGLTFHDGAPVTSEDCIASLKRWGVRDTMGQKLMQFTKELAVVDARTFTLTLKEPYGMVIESLGKPFVACRSSCPSASPRRRPTSRSPSSSAPARSSSRRSCGGRARRWSTRNSPTTSRGPSRRPAWPAARSPISTASNGSSCPTSRPRSTRCMRARSTWCSSRRSTCCRCSRRTRASRSIDLNTLGTHFAFRFNTLHKPFDDPRIRQAALYALNQKDVLQPASASRSTRRSARRCSPAARRCHRRGLGGQAQRQLRQVQGAPQEAGYDGTPLVLLPATDVNAGAADAGRQAAARARRLQGRHACRWIGRPCWHAARARRRRTGRLVGFITTLAPADILDPVISFFTAAACDKASIGWPCDARSRSCATTSRAPPIRPSARNSPRRCRRACRSSRPTRRSASTTCRWRGAPTSAATWKSPATVFWNVKKAP